MFNTTGQSAVVSPDGEAWLIAENAHAGNLRIIQYSLEHWPSITMPGTGPFPNGQASFDGRNGIWFGSLHWTGRRLIDCGRADSDGIGSHRPSLPAFPQPGGGTGLGRALTPFTAT